MPFARDQQTAAQTNTELVAAPGADRQLVVYSVYVDGDASGATILETGDSTLRWHVSEHHDARMFASDPNGLFRCAANEALTYTTTGTNPNVFVSVRYGETRFIE